MRWECHVGWYYAFGFYFGLEDSIMESIIILLLCWGLGASKFVKGAFVPTLSKQYEYVIQLVRTIAIEQEQLCRTIPRQNDSGTMLSQLDQKTT